MDSPSKNSQLPSKSNHTYPPYNNCFVMSPVNGASSKTMFTNVVLEKTKDLGKVADDKNLDNFKIDTGMTFMTSFSRQKVISLKYDCLDKLVHPDSSFIVEIINNSIPNAGTSISSAIFLDSSYRNNIYGFGKGYVYEYNVGDAASQTPHKIYLILHEKIDDYGEDYKGYAFCSDGIKWYKSQNGSDDVLSMIVSVKGTEKQLELLMNYDDDKFIPVAHSKLGNWAF